jgi:hypothetical protein
MVMFSFDGFRRSPAVEGRDSHESGFCLSDMSVARFVGACYSSHSGFEIEDSRSRNSVRHRKVPVLRLPEVLPHVHGGVHFNRFHWRQLLDFNYGAANTEKIVLRWC